MPRRAILVNDVRRPSSLGTEVMPTSVSCSDVMFGVLLFTKKLLGITPVKPGNEFAANTSMSDGLSCVRTAAMSPTMRDDVRVKLSSRGYSDSRDGTVVIFVDVSVRCESDGANRGSDPSTGELANETYSSDERRAITDGIVERSVGRFRKPKYEIRPVFVIEQQ